MDQLKVIEKLKGETFIVTGYQRAYRWGEREIEALLADIWDFAKLKESAPFYCLQPVVVKKDGDQYRIIDGQQRLTTIFLIIKFLRNENFFHIFYETRNESADFLQKIQDKTPREATNLDFFHFWNAYKFIKNFFSNRNIDKEKFETTLLKKCKIVWYEIGQAENESEVFVRLNIGKIPLAEAENIKALFLSKNKTLDSDELRERAEFWYKGEIEARDNRDFRYCVLSKVDENDIVRNEQPSLKDDILRIEAYLKAIVPYKNKKDKHYLFDYFYEHYKDGTLDDKWESLENAINTLSSFASARGGEKIDRTIFHYLGFLVLGGENIYTLYEKWRNNTTKEMFAEELLTVVKNKISKIDDLEKLRYDEQDDKEKIRNFLLLFNLEYLIRDESSNEFFKFNRFVLEQWNLEHIYAQKSKSIKEAINDKNNDEIGRWLQETLLYIDDPKLKQEIEQSIERIDFSQELFKRIDENFKSAETLHTIQNLTLLDGDSNRKIGNQIFSQKRLAIQRLSEQDKLIPIATKKVFNKEFSPNKSSPDIFTEDDQKAYLATIKEYLKKYAKDEK